MTQRLCKSCGDFHDLDEPWPAKCLGHHGYSKSSMQIIKDIDPYKTVAADVNGKQAHIGGRRQHREFLKRNDYVEVGNEMPQTSRIIRGDFDNSRDMKRAIDQLRSRH